MVPGPLAFPSASSASLLISSTSFDGGRTVTEGRVERYQRVAARVGFCAFIVEVPGRIDARQL